MPRFRTRTVFYICSFLLFYHLAFGLPSLASWQTYLGNSQGSDTFKQASKVDTSVTQAKAFDGSKPWKKRIVAIGDVHGDLAHARRVLEAAGLVDRHGSWIGGTATLVQTGDIVDRGTDTIALYRLMDTLREQASKAGGQVVSLLGNHEFMNGAINQPSGVRIGLSIAETALGDWRYVTAEDIATFHGEENRRKVMSSGWIGQTWLDNYQVAARVPYGPDMGIGNDPFGSAAVIAVHGGIHPSWANISRINEVGSSFLQRILKDRTPSAFQLPRDTPADERDLYSATGPLWYRGYALDSEAEDGICQQAELVLEKTKAKRMIMGHTPHFEGILSRCRGKVIIIDTGVSSAYGGVLSALEILYTIEPDKEQTAKRGVRRVVEKETVSAIYEGSRKVLVKKERIVET